MHELTVEEKNSIKSSFKQLSAGKVNLGKQFFTTLFEMAPLIKPMFKREMDIVEMHFNEIVGTAVDKIDHFNDIKPVLFELGRKHKSYGAHKEQFDIVKSALLLTIQSKLRQHSSPLIEDAWSNYYDNIATVMILGLESESKAALAATN